MSSKMLFSSETPGRVDWVTFSSIFPAYVHVLAPYYCVRFWIISVLIFCFDVRVNPITFFTALFESVFNH